MQLKEDELEVRDEPHAALTLAACVAFALEKQVSAANRNAYRHKQKPRSGRKRSASCQSLTRTCQETAGQGPVYCVVHIKRRRASE
jgi:hypothetical protein